MYIFKLKRDILFQLLIARLVNNNNRVFPIWVLDRARLDLIAHA